jgi:hypothetical protein
VGWVAEIFGARMSVIAGGVISAAATLVLGFILARRRGLRIRAYLRPAELASLLRMAA